MVIPILSGILGIRFVVEAAKREVTIGDKVLSVVAAISCFLVVATYFW